MLRNDIAFLTNVVARQNALSWVKNPFGQTTVKLFSSFASSTSENESILWKTKLKQTHIQIYNVSWEGKLIDNFHCIPLYFIRGTREYQ